MANRVIHISEEAAANDFAGLLARVREGVEIVIESSAHPIAVLRPVQVRGRLISESIAVAEAHAKELGFEPILDAEFAEDLREIIGNRKPREVQEWG